jgi:hypothetical protein
MRSPCSLCICMCIPFINFSMAKPIFMKLGKHVKAHEPISPAWHLKPLSPVIPLSEPLKFLSQNQYHDIWCLCCTKWNQFKCVLHKSLRSAIPTLRQLIVITVMTLERLNRSSWILVSISCNLNQFKRLIPSIFTVSNENIVKTKKN